MSYSLVSRHGFGVVSSSKLKLKSSGSRDACYSAILLKLLSNLKLFKSSQSNKYSKTYSILPSSRNEEFVYFKFWIDVGSRKENLFTEPSWIELQNLWNSFHRSFYSCKPFCDLHNQLLGSSPSCYQVIKPLHGVNLNPSRFGSQQT